MDTPFQFAQRGDKIVIDLLAHEKFVHLVLSLFHTESTHTIFPVLISMVQNVWIVLELAQRSDDANIDRTAHLSDNSVSALNRLLQFSPAIYSSGIENNCKILLKSSDVVALLSYASATTSKENYSTTNSSGTPKVHLLAVHRFWCAPMELSKLYSSADIYRSLM